MRVATIEQALKLAQAGGAAASQKYPSSLAPRVGAGFAIATGLLAAAAHAAARAGFDESGWLRRDAHHAVREVAFAAIPRVQLRAAEPLRVAPTRRRGLRARTATFRVRANELCEFGSFGLHPAVRTSHQGSVIHRRACKAQPLAVICLRFTAGRAFRRFQSVSRATRWTSTSRPGGNGRECLRSACDGDASSRRFAALRSRRAPIAGRRVGSSSRRRARWPIVWGWRRSWPSRRRPWGNPTFRRCALRTGSPRP